VRIYPTVVLAGTALEALWRSGRYEPLTPDAAAEICARLIAVLRAHGLPTENPYSAEELMTVALRDKKRRGNTLTLIVPHTIGDCALHEIATGDLAQWIAEGSDT